jgi:uncharacterized protein
MLRDTILSVLEGPFFASGSADVPRLNAAAAAKASRANTAVILGVRRAGKSTLQAEWMHSLPKGKTLYCNFEDTRLYGFGPTDFASFLEAVAFVKGNPKDIFLDEVQEVDEWQRLVRALLDRGYFVCITGSNASLLGKELGSKLTGRHSSHEVFPFDFATFLKFTKQKANGASYEDYLDNGGFPAFLRDRDPQALRDLLRDIVLRDIASRNGLRETRHLMNLALFLISNTGQPFSFQRLSKSLAIPTVGQTSAYVEFLNDAYLIMPLPKWSSSFKQRVTTPNKFYAIDNGMRLANSVTASPDRGHQLENAVFLALRRDGEEIFYAGEKDDWECDFVTRNELLQVTTQLSRENHAREIRGLVEAAKKIKGRKAVLLTLNQADRLVASGVSIEVRPAWEWELARKAANPNRLFR